MIAIGPPNGFRLPLEAPGSGTLPLPFADVPPKSIFRPPNGLAGCEAGSRSAWSSDMAAS